MKKKWWLVLAAAALFSLAAAEGLVRLYHYRVHPVCPAYFNLEFDPYYQLSSTPGLVYEIKPGVVLPDDLRQHSDALTNSRGFRDREFAVPKPAGTFRIMGLGDSICYGAMIGRGQTFLKVLEEKLNSGEVSRRYESVNCCVSGYNLEQDYLTLKEKAIFYQPDLIVLSIWIDDLTPPYVPSFVNRKLLGRIHHYVIDRSFLWKLLFYRFVSPGLYGRDIMQTSEDDNLESLSRLIDLAREEHAQVACIFHSTMRPDYSEKIASSRPYQRIKALLFKKNVPWLEMHRVYLDYLGSRGIEEIANAPGDPHPNAEGNRVIAEALAGFLKKSGLLGTN